MLLQMGSSCGDDSLYPEALGAERLRGYGYSGITGTNVRCVVKAPAVTKAAGTKDCENGDRIVLFQSLAFCK